MTAHLTTEIAGRDGGATILSAAKELEPGARVMLLLADGLFRLDVLVQGDSLQTFVRNLSVRQLAFRQDVADPGAATTGDVTALSPRRASLGFTLGADDDLLLVRVTVATVSFNERGTVRVGAQGVLRGLRAG